VKAHIIDASIAVKWVVEEAGTADALALRQQARLIAPSFWSQNVRTFSGRRFGATNCRKMKPFLQPVSFRVPTLN
jgi:hypothetical protein